MGKALKGIAEENNFEVVAIIDPVSGQATAKEISKESLNKAEVCIDFTTPEAALKNIEKYCKLGKNAVVATTGWYDRLEDVKKAVEKGGIGLIYAGNFSIGVNAFYRIVEKAAEIFNSIPEYDIFGLEMHHKGKKDSPSGTAKNIEKMLLEKIERKRKAVEEKLDRQILEEEMHFASVRGGSVPGTHAVFFDSPADTIELKHTARNREGFALGALKAAEFIKGKKGLFTIDDLMKEMIK